MNSRFEIRGNRRNAAHLTQIPLASSPIFDYIFMSSEVISMDTINLNIDSKNRISLTKLLPPGNIRSVRAHTEGHRIILEPMTEVPVDEAWLFENKGSLKKVLNGFSQKGSINRGSFAKYAKQLTVHVRTCFHPAGRP